MRAEHDHIQTHGRAHIYAGFRYIDDLLLFVDPAFDRDTLEGIFPHPLELEVEEHNGSFRFLMSWNILQQDGALTTSYFHKNAHRAAEGLRPLKNIVHFTSHCPRSQKVARVVGDLHRVCRHSLHPHKCPTDITLALQELTAQGVPRGVLQSAVRRFITRPGATPITQLFN